MRNFTFQLIILIACSFYFSQVSAQIRLTTQAGVNAWDRGIVNVQDTLIILGEDEITNLDSLSNIRSIEGDFRIMYNEVLTNLEGLNNLMIIGGELEIQFNDALTQIDGLESLEYVDGFLNIARNGALVNVDGLSNLSSTGSGVNFEDNYALTNLDGLSRLSSINGGLYIEDNFVLTNVDGLSSVTAIDGDLSFKSNTILMNINGIRNLRSNQDGSSTLSIEDNDALVDCCGIAYGLRDSLEFSDISIEDNPSSCSSLQEILDANCMILNTTEINGSTLKIYPNPNYGEFKLSFRLENEIQVYFQVADVLGNIFITGQLDDKALRDNGIDIDLDDSPNGIYFVRLVTPIGQQTIKFILDKM